MEISNAVLAYHKANRYDKIFAKKDLLGKKLHVHNVISLAHTIAEFSSYDVDYELLAICAEHHDDGRVDQYNLLGSFMDTVISHNVLSLNRLEHFLLQHGFNKLDPSIKILRDVMLYHGRMWLNDLSKESKPYVEIITAADEFENACSGISYLLKETKTDAKGYIQQNPHIDQKKVSTFVWEHFCKGEKFDKIKHCSTYAEYVLFVATLAINCIKTYHEIAKTAFLQEGYGYSSILEGYHDVFKQTLSPNMAKQAYHILSTMVA